MSTPTDIQLTLLQMIALALPAFAILMQALLRFHELGEDGVEYGFSTEFRFLELSFIFIVSSGAIVSYTLIGTTSSLLVKLAIGFVITGLLFTIPATWFGLRRPEYPSERFDSPEEAIRYGAENMIIYAVPLVVGISVVAVVYILGQFLESVFDTFSVLFNEIGVSVPLAFDVALAIFAGYTILFVTLGIRRISNEYIAYIAQREMLDKWQKDMFELTEELLEILKDNSVDGILENRRLRNRLLRTIEQIDQTADSTPDDIDETTLELINELNVTIDSFREIVEELSEVQSRHLEIGNVIDDTQTLLRTVEGQISPIEEHYTLSDMPTEIRDEYEEWKERKSELENQLDRMETEWKYLQEERKSLIEEMGELMEHAEQIGENLMKQISENAGPTKDT